MRRGTVLLVVAVLVADAAAYSARGESSPPEKSDAARGKESLPAGSQDGVLGPSDEAPAGEAAESKYSGGCTSPDCHADLMEAKQIHGPVAVGSCDVCHRAVAGEEHSFELARDDGELCTFCHAPKPLAVQHKPFEVGACQSCHAPHGGVDRKYLLEGMTAESICEECHEREEHPAAHKPYAEGQCTACHSAHQSEESGLLRNAQHRLCLSCHEALADEMRSASSFHAPAKEGKCGTCHEPHGGTRRWMLAAGYPEDIYAGFDEETYELCFVCHSVDAFTEATSEDTAFRDGDRNLHLLHVNKPEKGRSCAACHSPHAAPLPKLIRKKVPFGKWELPIDFEATPTGGTCSTGCHKVLSYSRGATQE